MKKVFALGIILVLGGVLGIGYVFFAQSPVDDRKGQRIGIITPLTGDLAYWGASTQLGAELARRELAQQGIQIQLVFEDGQLTADSAMSAARKLRHVDQVQAIYSEFAPAAAAVPLVLDGSSILHVYDAGLVSSLQERPLIYKTYIDYQLGCRMLAEEIRRRGIQRVGVLQLQLEPGELCLKGIREIFGDRLAVEGYPPGTIDFRTQLVKLLQAGQVEAVINVSFPQEMILSLKQLRELQGTQLFAGSAEDLSEEVIQEQASLLEGALFFGLPPIGQEFLSRVQTEFPTTSIGNRRALALAYLHVKQMGLALAKCHQETSCLDSEMAASVPDTSLGFEGFQDRVARFRIVVQEMRGGVLSP